MPRTEPFVKKKSKLNDSDNHNFNFRHVNGNSSILSKKTYNIGLRKRLLRKRIPNLKAIHRNTVGKPSHKAIDYVHEKVLAKDTSRYMSELGFMTRFKGVGEHKKWKFPEVTEKNLGFYEDLFSKAQSNYKYDKPRIEKRFIGPKNPTNNKGKMKQEVRHKMGNVFQVYEWFLESWEGKIKKAKYDT